LGGHPRLSKLQLSGEPFASEPFLVQSPLLRLHMNAHRINLVPLLLKLPRRFLQRLARTEQRKAPKTFRPTHSDDHDTLSIVECPSKRLSL
jgi:hypothetical protein